SAGRQTGRIYRLPNPTLTRRLVRRPYICGSWSRDGVNDGLPIQRDETSNDLSWANPWPRILGLSDSILSNPVSIAGGVSRPPYDYVVVYILQPAFWQFWGKPETPFDF